MSLAGKIQTGVIGVMRSLFGLSQSGGAISIGSSALPSGSTFTITVRDFTYQFSDGAGTGLTFMNSGSVEHNFGTSQYKMASDVGIGWSSNTNATAANADACMSRAAAAVIRTTDASGAIPSWIQNTASLARVTADITNATVTPANITDLSITLVASRRYVGRMVIKCTDSTAAEGVRIDFDGGAAVMTDFACGAAQLTGGTVVSSVTVSSAIATDLVWTTITGETWLVFEFSMLVSGTGGTFIPRFAQSTHAAGTLTLSKGSYIQLHDSPT